MSHCCFQKVGGKKVTVTGFSVMYSQIQYMCNVFTRTKYLSLVSNEEMIKKNTFWTRLKPL